MNIQDSTRIINFREVNEDEVRDVEDTEDSTSGYSFVFAASISFDFRYIAILGCKYATGPSRLLGIHSTSTGRKICETADVDPLEVRSGGDGVWFTPGGSDVWCVAADKANVFTITQDAFEHTKTVVDIEDGSWGCPWGSSCNYKHGWILGADGKRLLMLPPFWKSAFKVDRVWNGKFLALLHGRLPEPVILELEP